MHALCADIRQNGGCLSFFLICHSYNRDFFTECEVKAEAFTRDWLELGGGVHYPRQASSHGLVQKGNPHRFPTLYSAKAWPIAKEEAAFRLSATERLFDRQRRSKGRVRSLPEVYSVFF